MSLPQYLLNTVYPKHTNYSSVYKSKAYELRSMLPGFCAAMNSNSVLMFLDNPPVLSSRVKQSMENAFIMGQAVHEESIPLAMYDP
jgi:hypothetical protein